MIKKILKMTILIFLICGIGICISACIGWKTVKIEGIGSITVPINWIYTIDDDVIYFTDKPLTEEDYKIFLIQPKDYPNPHTTLVVTNKFSIELNTKILDSRLLSNGINYGEEELESDGIIRREYYIDFFCLDKFTELITWDNLVDFETIKKIAVSYDPE